MKARLGEAVVLSVIGLVAFVEVLGTTALMAQLLWRRARAEWEDL